MLTIYCFQEVFLAVRTCHRSAVGMHNINCPIIVFTFVIPDKRSAIWNPVWL